MRLFPRNRTLTDSQLGVLVTYLTYPLAVPEARVVLEDFSGVASRKNLLKCATS